MNFAFVSRERRDKQISVDRESYGYVTEADFWDVNTISHERTPLMRYEVQRRR